MKAHRAALEKRLYDVSTPGNPLYGQHLSQQELLEFTRPTEESSNTVLEWLRHSGVEKVDNKGEWIHFTTTTGQANKLLNTNFKVYRHGEDKESDSIRTTEVFFPQNVLPHVKMIHPTTRFVHLKAQTSLIHEMSDIIDEPVSRVIAPDQARVCGSGVDPKCIRKLYKIGDVAKVSGSPSRYTVGKLQVDAQNAGQIGIAGFLDQYARFSDLDQFVGQQLRDWKGVSFNWTSVNSKFTALKTSLTRLRGTAGPKIAQGLWRGQPRYPMVHRHELPRAEPLL
jgi:tripeptidyl-peptidase-1